MNKPIKAGIIGGAGYTGGETLRLLLNHPETEVAFVQSKSQAGKKITDIHTDLLGDTSLLFTPAPTTTADVVFLCVGHGEAIKYLSENPLPSSTRIIDLSQDHRLKREVNSATPATYGTNWIYGLPELKRKQIAGAARVANPGCFATCIQLALLPFVQQGAMNSDIHISATTGSTGAGQSLSASSHFSWRQNNLSAYKVFTHQHLAEISQSFEQVHPGFGHELHFVPYRGSFTRGILAGIYFESDLRLEDAFMLAQDYYAEHPFVHLSKQPVDLKQVVNTNKCLLHFEKQGNQLFITSIIDNLLKGAAGQAVQNMNLMFGFEETCGLRLKASAF